MPTYEYVCKKCEKEFEVFQSMNDARLTDCPEDDCDGEVRRKIGTGAGLIFKGSGFYETDYRSDSYKDGAKKDKEKKETKSSGDSSSSTKETKPSPKSSGSSESSGSSSTSSSDSGSSGTSKS